MFGLRSDGYRVKGLDPIDQIGAQIMHTRNDAMNFNTMPVRVENIDNWIREKSDKEGIRFSYMHVVIASMVRTYALRQRLNRFVVNGRIYQRNGLYMSISTKVSLSDESPELTTKIRFTGQENIYDIKEKIDKAIKDSTEADRENGSTKTAGKITAIPSFLIGAGVGFLKLLDRYGCLGKKLIDISPFHTSFYLTNLKSIKGDWIFHHLYNFGTTGMFVSIGKEKLEPCVNADEKLEVGKVMTLGITTDERYADGFYMLKSQRLWKTFLADPSKLEERLDIEPIESPKERKKRLKKETKEKKLQEKKKLKEANSTQSKEEKTSKNTKSKKK